METKRALKHIPAFLITTLASLATMILIRKVVHDAMKEADKPNKHQGGFDR